MNLEQLKKNIGWRVQLAPSAIHLDALGRELPSRNEDWIIQSVDATEVRVEEASIPGLMTTFGADVVHRFDTNRSRSDAGGSQFGFLVLTQQMVIQQGKITYRPCSRPGEHVPPPPVTIVEQWVDFSFPIKSGIQTSLEESGYRVAWVNASRLPSLEFEGWEMVIEKDRYGMPSSFHLRTNPENMVFVKTRQPDLEKLANSPIWKSKPGLVSCTVSPDGRELVFAFDGPTQAIAFLLSMNRDPSVIRCAMAPGRVDTVVGRLTEDGARMVRPQG
jgi:hypothetical protein